MTERFRHISAVSRPESRSSPERSRRVQVAVVPFLAASSDHHMDATRQMPREYDPLALTIIQDRDGVRSVEFPGGTMEDGDEESMRKTALRELGEEVGLTEEDITLFFPPVASGIHRNGSGELASYFFLQGQLHRFIPAQELHDRQDLQPHEKIVIAYYRFSELVKMKGTRMVEPRSLHAIKALESGVDNQGQRVHAYSRFLDRTQGRAA